MALPQIPECSVEQRDDGTYLITHNLSGDKAEADTLEQVEIQAIILRCAAAYKVGIEAP